MVGRTLAHYKILKKIGSGGMGDVYLAEDTKLDRRVALKVLPPEVAGSEERRARFEREAKTVAALNHPNIVTVHSVEESDGVHFLTMELVKGKTIAALLPKKGLSLGELLEIGIPLTDAVAAAHERGIIHRDLKPGNVMVTDDHTSKSPTSTREDDGRGPRRPSEPHRREDGGGHRRNGELHVSRAGGGEGH
jgi:serine/threonine protein kinase